METDIQQSPAEFQQLLQNLESEIYRCQTLVKSEDEKLIRYKVT